MVREAEALRAAARESLAGKWDAAVVFTLVYMLIMAVPGGFSFNYPELANILQILLLPLGYGYAVAFLRNIRHGGELALRSMFDGFRDYGRIFGTLALEFVYVFLWTLLLVVPGIIKYYSYSQTSYILLDHPELKYNAAIERSMAMMDGHKFDLFYLHLTFIGWWLLCILTLGIGFLWLSPYMMAAQAHFYEDVKADYEKRLAQAG